MDLLHKYRPFDLAHRAECERTLQMLRDRTIWMAAPSSFNDPFDCQPSILRNKKTEERDLAKILKNRLHVIKKALRTGQQLANRQLQPIPHRQLVTLRRLLESRKPDNQKYNVLHGDKAFRELKARLDRVGVISLSAIPTQMLMWAHYASQHMGFCLGFERSEKSLLADQRHTKPVKYLETYPTVDLTNLELSWAFSIGEDAISESLEIDIQEPHLQAVIYSKAIDWEYEQEWRVLAPTGGRVSPYPGALKQVIFGLRCHGDSRRAIQDAVMEAQAECPIQFSEIETDGGSFALRVRDLHTVSCAQA